MRAFTLNNLGQIQSITGIATYGYDGNGRRIKVTKSGTTEYTLYDRAGRLVYTEQGTTRTDYLSVGGHTVVELKKTGTTTTPTYLHPDLLGSPRKATTQAKALLWSEHYNPYGLKMNGVNQKIGYTGHAHDTESGYTYMQARFYDPLVGRFLSTDPIHFVDENPFSFNRYSYANNNPYRYIDPFGLSPAETGSRIRGSRGIQFRSTAPLRSRDGQTTARSSPRTLEQVRTDNPLNKFNDGVSSKLQSERGSGTDLANAANWVGVPGDVRDRTRQYVVQTWAAVGIFGLAATSAPPVIAFAAPVVRKHGLEIAVEIILNVNMMTVPLTHINPHAPVPPIMSPGHHIRHVPHPVARAGYVIVSGGR